MLTSAGGILPIMTKKEKPKSEVENIIAKSGHNLHEWTVNYLMDEDYRVEISPYYVDAHTDKPREVDIVARKRMRVFQKTDEHAVNLVLAIDCKYLKQPTVFWAFPNEKNHSALKVTGANLEELFGNAGEGSFIYFGAEPIARLFQSGDRSSDEPTTDPIYKACSQAISGAIFAREHSKGPSIIYPVVIVDGPGGLFFAENPYKEIASLIVHIDYSYYSDRDTSKKAVREPFYVLIVRKERVESLKNLLEKEANALRNLVATNQQEIAYQREKKSGGSNPAR
jgi:hypothetical protein